MSEFVYNFQWSYALHDFWCQVAIAALMIFCDRMGHDFHECEGGILVVDLLPCLECGAGL